MVSLTILELLNGYKQLGLDLTVIKKNIQNLVMPSMLNLHLKFQ